LSILFSRDCKSLDCCPGYKKVPFLNILTFSYAVEQKSVLSHRIFVVEDYSNCDLAFTRFSMLNILNSVWHRLLGYKKESSVLRLKLTRHRDIAK